MGKLRELDSTDFLKADPQLFDECSAKHRADEEEEGRREQDTPKLKTAAVENF